MPPAITKYKLVSAANLEDIVSLVNVEIGQGWQPFGAITDVAGGYTQIMVIYQTGVEK